MIKACEYCGADFEPKKQVGKRQRFCCEDCQRAWWANHPEASKRKRYTYTCQNCGKEYTAKAKDRDKFCSRECAFAFKTMIREQRELDEALGIGTFCKVYFPRCSECGKLFTAKRDGCLVCSHECHLDRGKRLWIEYKEAIGRNAGRVEILVCEYCGKEFEHEIYNQIPRFCSKRCSRLSWNEANPNRYFHMRADQRHRRRARKYGNDVFQSIDPLLIYMRDGWRCGICGQIVDPTLKHPDPMSASLDHIIPLAVGGTHTRQNVQLAHMICNSSKQDTGGGQLRLGLKLDCKANAQCYT